MAFTESSEEDKEIRMEYIKSIDVNAQFIPNRNNKKSFIAFFDSIFMDEIKQPISVIKDLLIEIKKSISDNKDLVRSEPISICERPEAISEKTQAQRRRGR